MQKKIIIIIKFRMHHLSYECDLANFTWAPSILSLPLLQFLQYFFFHLNFPEFE